MADTQNPGFEDSLAELDALVSHMEDGNLSLDEALACFEKGIQLTRTCQQVLQEAELKVQQLTLDSNGQPRSEPFEPKQD